MVTLSAQVFALTHSTEQVLVRDTLFLAQLCGSHIRVTNVAGVVSWCVSVNVTGLIHQNVQSFGVKVHTAGK